MKIFIGFGYNDDDKWVKEYVFPLVESFGAQVVTGEELHGEKLSTGVKEKIRTSDGLLGFLTRRKKTGDDAYDSHIWVQHELAYADFIGIPLVPILEAKVDKQLGMLYDIQRIDFELDNKALLLVEIAKALNKWRRNLETRRLVLLPKNLAEQIRPYIDTPKLTCSYNFFYDKLITSENYPGKIFDMADGDMIMYIKNIPSDDAAVQVKIMGPGIYWVSKHTPCNSFGLTLGG